MASVVSIEIGNTVTKVCEIEVKKKNPRIFKSFEFETPDETVEDGYIKSVTSFASELEAKFREYGIKNKEVVFTITSSKIANREVSIPYVKKEKIGNIVQYNAPEYFPVDLSSYHISHTVLETIITQEEKSIRLMVLAVPVDLLESYFILAKAAEIRIVDIDYSGNAAFQVLKMIAPKGASINVHVNETTSMITVINDGILSLQRTIGYGVSSAVEAIMGLDTYRFREDFESADALELLKYMHLIKETFDAKSTEEDPSLVELQDEVTDSLQFLVSNISRVIDYFTSRHNQIDIDAVYLTGLGSELLGFSELLEYEFDCPVQIMDELEAVVLDKGSEDIVYGLYIMPIGATVAPMALIPDEFRVVDTIRNDSMLVPIIFVLAAIAGSVALILTSNINYELKEAEKRKVQKSIEELTPIRKVEAQYVQTRSIRDQLQRFKDFTVTPLDNIVGMINDLEKAFPENSKILEFSATKTEMIFDVETNTKDEMIDLVLRLKDLDFFTDVKTNNVTSSFFKTEESEDSDNYFGLAVEKEVCSFQLVCNLKQVALEGDEAKGTPLEAVREGK